MSDRYAAEDCGFAVSDIHNIIHWAPFEQPSDSSYAYDHFDTGSWADRIAVRCMGHRCIKMQWRVSRDFARVTCIQCIGTRETLQETIEEFL